MDTALRWLFYAVLLLAVANAIADSRNLAPGFASLPNGAKVVVMPLDVSLYAMDTNGTLEERPEWTRAAIRHLHAALAADKRMSGLVTEDLPAKKSAAFSEVIALHDAVARSIVQYQFQLGSQGLPTKKGLLDWSLGPAVQGLRKASGADYALFVSIRDSYASPERKLLVAGAMLLVGFDAVGGGKQTGYASLVDLKSGRIVWFNRLERGQGDLQDPRSVPETLDTVLDQFPAVR